MALPTPPPGDPEVRFYTWVALRPIFRVCPAGYPANAFNPTTSSGRFRPFFCGGTTPVPTLYGSNRVDGALGETVFHDVPAGHASWNIPRTSLYGLLRTNLIPRRE